MRNGYHQHVKYWCIIWSRYRLNTVCIISSVIVKDSSVANNQMNDASFRFPSIIHLKMLCYLHDWFKSILNLMSSSFIDTKQNEILLYYVSLDENPIMNHYKDCYKGIPFLQTVFIIFLYIKVQFFSANMLNIIKPKWKNDNKQVAVL